MGYACESDLRNQLLLLATLGQLQAFLDRLSKIKKSLIESLPFGIAKMTSVDIKPRRYGLAALVPPARPQVISIYLAQPDR